VNLKQAAAVMNVSPRLVHQARKLQSSGRQDLIQAVSNGRMTVGAALRALAGTAPPNRIARFKAIWRNCTQAERGAIVDWINDQIEGAQ
jgi:hypothetical protein